jgi:hypothetical protein
MLNKFRNKLGFAHATGRVIFNLKTMEDIPGLVTEVEMNEVDLITIISKTRPSEDSNSEDLFDEEPKKFTIKRLERGSNE